MREGWSTIVFVVEPISALDDLDFEDRVIAELARPSALLYIDHDCVEFGVEGDPASFDAADLERQIKSAFPDATGVRVVRISRPTSLRRRLADWVGRGARI